MPTTLVTLAFLLFVSLNGSLTRQMGAIDILSGTLPGCLNATAHSTPDNDIHTLDMARWDDVASQVAEGRAITAPVKDELQQGVIAYVLVGARDNLDRGITNTKVEQSTVLGHQKPFHRAL